MRQGSTLYYLMSDHLGSTSLTTNASGGVISDMKYKAWGEVRFQSGTSPTDYTYTGQKSYTESFGLMFYNARWLDVSLGRFAQADSIVPGGVQGYDRYAYVNNNPVRHIDPTGHICREGDNTGRSCDGANKVGYKANGGGLDVGIRRIIGKSTGQANTLSLSLTLPITTTATPANTRTSTPTTTATPTMTATATASATITPSVTSTPSASSTPSATATSPYGYVWGTLYPTTTPGPTNAVSNAVGDYIQPGGYFDPSPELPLDFPSVGTLFDEWGQSRPTYGQPVVNDVGKWYTGEKLFEILVSSYVNYHAPVILLPIGPDTLDFMFPSVTYQ
jgi:RHS repeat-associated protein